MSYSNGPGGISIHAVDIAAGRAATGLAVSLLRIEGERAVVVAAGMIADDGHFDDPIRTGAGLSPGLYEARFDIGAHYGRSGTATFLDIAPFRFRIADGAEHLHLPLKFTPFGLMLFRGV